MITDNLIDSEITSTLIDEPIGFYIGAWHFYIYPPTLGTKMLQAKYIKMLNLDDEMLKKNPVFTLTKAVIEKRQEAIRLLSISTFKAKEALDNIEVQSRADFLDKNLTDEELAKLLISVLTSDRTEEYMEKLGISRELKKQQEIAKAKDTSNSVTTGGVTIYGTLIAGACEKFGWTFDYVVWGISYTNLRLLMADSPSTVVLTKDEQKKIRIDIKGKSKDVIKADDPASKAIIEEFIKSHH